MRRLLPPLSTADPSLAGELSDDDLFAAYTYPAGRQWVRANMVASLDGAGSEGGLSAGLSSPGDRRTFRVLRSLADVIVAGAATVVAEGYRAVQPGETYAERRVAAGMTATAPIAVVTRRLGLDLSSALFGGPERTVVLTVGAVGAERLAAARQVADVVVCGDSDVDLALAFAALADRGLNRVLCEGGPTLLSQVVAAGRLDELCLTVTPKLVGGGAGRVTAGPAFAVPRQMSLAHLLEDHGTLLQRWVTPATA